MTRIDDKGEFMQRENAAKGARRNLEKVEREHLTTDQRIQVAFGYIGLAIAEEMNRHTLVQADIHKVKGHDKT